MQRRDNLVTLFVWFGKIYEVHTISVNCIEGTVALVDSIRFDRLENNWLVTFYIGVHGPYDRGLELRPGNCQECCCILRGI